MSVIRQKKIMTSLRKTKMGQLKNNLVDDAVQPIDCGTKTDHKAIQTARIKAKKDIIHLFQNSVETCPYCNGRGDVYDSSKTHCRSLEPTYVKCPVCHGSGEVFEDQLENIDCDKSVRELIQQNKDEASLARWEIEQNR